MTDHANGYLLGTTMLAGVPEHFPTRSPHSVPSDEGASEELRAAVLAISSAPPAQRLLTLQNEAIRLGRCDHVDTSEILAALTRAAEEHGLCQIPGIDRDAVKHIISEGVQGRESLADPPPIEWPADMEIPAADAAASWSDPDLSLLDDRRGTLPRFPVHVLSPQWREWIALAAHGAGVTEGHVIVPLFSIASSLIGAARRVQASRSWSEPVTSWTAVVGFSGSGKTPGIDVTKRHLDRIERDRKSRNADLQRAHDTKSEAARAAGKKWKKEVEEAIGAGTPPPPQPIEATDPGDFVPPRLYVSNVTIERIGVLLQARQRGMLVIADELAGLFMNMVRYSNGSDREFWLEAWNGKSFVIERLGRPAVNLDNLLIGITGGLQPDKLARSLEGDADGMYARIMFAWPDEPAYKPLTNEIAEIEPQILNALCRLIDLPDGEDRNFAPRSIPLASDALLTFEQFRQFLHDSKGGLDGREREWCAKGASHVLRLAGTLAYLNWAIGDDHEPSYISGATIEAAVEIWRDYFWPHSRAALRQIGISERHANARRVLRWARAHGKATLTIKDARREALAQSLDAKQTADLLATLVVAGWLKQEKPVKTGGRPVQRWAVNPILFTHAESAESAESPQVRGASGGPDGLMAVPALSAPGLGGAHERRPFHHSGRRRCL